jgi:hypothetical protein
MSLNGKEGDKRLNQNQRDGTARKTHLDKSNLKMEKAPVPRDMLSL